MMMVGLGGNNGSTLTASILANIHGISWQTKEGTCKPNYYGSLTQSSTICLGDDKDGKEVYLPIRDLLPMLNPNDLVIGGWDINGTNLADAMERASVLDYDLQQKLRPYLTGIVPLPSIYYPEYIASNQSVRADNVLANSTKTQDLDSIRQDIRDFKAVHDLETVIVMWTANTERCTPVRHGLNMTPTEVLASIENNDADISPSNIFATAAILEGCPYLNGSPQNTLVPGIVDMATEHGVFIGGNDFKSGQTKLKTSLVEMLVGAGMKPEAIVSYNHLGNNDGKNLQGEEQFKSKEISKAGVIDDIVQSNAILYGPGESPDHCVVIKYVPFVRDSKRAMDEYTSSIFMNGRSTIAVHNTCEDSLLSSPLIIDLVVLTELMTRVRYKTCQTSGFVPFESVLSILSYLMKAPATPGSEPVVNSLGRQHRCITNILRAFVGLPPNNDMLLTHKTSAVSYD
jgi:myo-inositol-1-phosphate synthase